MALRKIWEGKKGNDIARVYRDADWGEYRLRFYPGGVLREEADYFTSDKDDAIESAIAVGYVAVVKGAKQNPARRATKKDEKAEFLEQDRAYHNGYDEAVEMIERDGYNEAMRFFHSEQKRKPAPGVLNAARHRGFLAGWRDALSENQVKANPTKRKAPMAKAPKKNPAKKSYTFGIHLNAGNTTSGNPRRLFVLYSSTGNVVDIIDEGYRGVGAVSDAGYSTAPPIVGQFRITPAEYTGLLKRKK